MRLTALNSTNSMSIEARGDTAVMTETRLAALLISRRASASSGGINSRSVRCTKIAAIDDVALVRFEPRAAARERRHRPREAQEFADDGLAVGAVVAFDRAQRMRARRIDRGEPEQAHDLAEQDHERAPARQEPARIAAT